MKRAILFAMIAMILFGCRTDNYQFIIHMNDGRQLKAYDVHFENNNILVWPACKDSGMYYLPTCEYNRIEWVGWHDLEDKRKRY